LTVETATPPDVTAKAVVVAELAHACGMAAHRLPITMHNHAITHAAEPRLWQNVGLRSPNKADGDIATLESEITAKLPSS
jgi:hypothetical protein